MPHGHLVGGPGAEESLPMWGTPSKGFVKLDPPDQCSSSSVHLNNHGGDFRRRRQVRQRVNETIFL